MIIERKASDDGNWNLVIVGSNPTGVELAGAFSEMKTYILPRDYPRMNFDRSQHYSHQFRRQTIGSNEH
jgi:NADH dehydrogenase